MPNEPSQKCNVAASAHRHPNIRQRARARKTRINMNDGRTAFLRFHHPAETDRMRLGHRGAFDQNAIGVAEILLRGRSSAPAEGGAQTGHRAAMSYPCLVRDAHHPETKREQFSNEIILFVIERGAAEMTDRGGVIDRVSL